MMSDVIRCEIMRQMKIGQKGRNARQVLKHDCQKQIRSDTLFSEAVRVNTGLETIKWSDAVRSNQKLSEAIKSYQMLSEVVRSEF